ncbi:TPA: flagellar hook-length control protein FliK [Stenotrophomonas maltophilia]|jgi:flagellar hook-length control protein FliK|uniref:flagellar hook-length control protein FliK n=1 Tax=Stenotrophomonas TaxID=40323 RepID=UPI001AA0F4D2|nr:MULTISPECIES: flagellar hook-length control protein FliK [Stenotrophomonas]MBO1744725.1 flagellar hook-length control protein FliK [Stenotrophomonas maltophilia]MCU1174850.1 flagellar hook-length control protein FliK [Stenotrophomonas maltophilia]WAP03884.1 flagellar hook-length control protein FliK [Stenotrophomonas sp. SBJS02]HEA4093990.1 flagellar hook-length control protein FliK [Stenotrophomonas maltophilia]HEA4099073.1 flagellar hook-length control protein FliK [Stenotrophomonas malto
MPAPLASSANAQPQNSGSSATRAPRGDGNKEFSQLLQGGSSGADAPSKPSKASNTPTPSTQGPASDNNGQAGAERRPDSAAAPEETAATVPTAQAKPAAEKDAQAAAEEAPWPPLGLAGLVLAVPAPADPAAALPAVTATATDADGNAPPAPAALPVAAALPSTAAATTSSTAEGNAPSGADQVTTLPLPELVLPGKRSERGEGSDAPLIGDRTAAPLLHAPGNAAVQDLKTALATGNAIFNGEPTPKPVLGDDGFDQAIGARLGWLADQKIGHAHIRLSPDDMGPVDVRLQLNGDKVHASFSSPHVDVRQALESSLPRLRELLGEQGFQLAHADVGHQAPGGDGNASGQAGGGGMAGDGEPSPAEGGVSSAQLIRQRGLLDAYA